MHFPTLLAAATALAAPLTAAASIAAIPAAAWTPRVNAIAVQKSGGFKDMILSDLRTNTLVGTNATADDREISFHLADPNFNTTTTCSTTFHTTPSNSSTYLPCAPNPGVKESYRFYFASYTSLGSFSLQLTHSFSDPANYPPPWDVVGLFATVNVTLSCEGGGGGGEECSQKEGEVLRAPINGAVN